ncbi:hypothetical protein ACH4D3_04810 [Streptomyces sp. NPDC018026]|uniref:hypothetical protein n=1 Tax=Streptomyces sp. NPDC018026 TaxID=3365031 RepID=UPI00379CA128
MTAARTPQEVFADHGTRLGTGDLDPIGRNRTEDAVSLFLPWTAAGAGHEVTDGVDTFVLRDGLISAQTVRNTLVPRTN